jgi:hypothetical protein
MLTTGLLRLSEEVNESVTVSPDLASVVSLLLEERPT